MILRALGIGEEVEVDTYELEVHSGDVYLLCSEGSAGLVHDEVIDEVVSGADKLHQAAVELIEIANIAGGPDNITTVLFRIGS